MKLLDSIFKSRDITFLTKVHIVKAMVFPIVTYGCENVVFIPISKKGNAKEYSNYCTIALISYTSKVMLKILQVRLQQYVNQELSDVQVVFRKG